MSQATESKTVATRPGELLEEVRESARVGQHAAAEAIRDFRRILDDAIPEAVQPLRTKIVDAAVELADKLVAAQYQFNRNLIRTADRALSKSDDKGEGTEA
ncbi:hypothetical protein Mycch_1486 [Mycolicibacterium chubuense NBB4]|uniref:Uncharacterized protein n=1 Tax=Mycolicibacterium chubuense (strain NBB4) TaxID=710421 RepID=I4BG79_MYCCN|nr:hypothetical protein [Mycolicibacterium chubuense]AFM16286.1 hypothetical protein Mycch_1486 [Mycolicibacterium chubuense NBB4]